MMTAVTLDEAPEALRLQGEFHLWESAVVP